MTDNQEAPAEKELYCSVNPELDDNGHIMLKYAFFSSHFALAVRVPWEKATEMISGLREQTLNLTKDIMAQEKAGPKSKLDVVKEIPDALRHKKNRG